MKKAKRNLLAAAACGVIFSCSKEPQVQAIDYRAISSVEAEIKREIGLYMAAATKPATMVNERGELIELRTNDPADFFCGRGAVAFDILSARADMLVTNEIVKSGNLTVNIPVNAGTIGPSGEISSDQITTHELVYNVWFDPLAEQQKQKAPFLQNPVTQEQIDAAPIASTLLNLRSSLIAAALKVDPYTGKPRQPIPCDWNWNIDPKKPGGDPGDTVKYGFTVTRSGKVGFGVKLTLVDVGLSAEKKSASGNTLTVSFYQAGTLDVEPDKKALAGPLKRAGDPGDRSLPLKPSGAPWHQWGAFLVPVASYKLPSDGLMSNSVPEPNSVPAKCKEICDAKGEHSVSCLKCKGEGQHVLPAPDGQSRNAPMTNQAQPHPSQ